MSRWKELNCDRGSYTLIPLTAMPCGRRVLKGHARQGPCLWPLRRLEAIPSGLGAALAFLDNSRPVVVNWRWSKK